MPGHSSGGNPATDGCHIGSIEHQTLGPFESGHFRHLRVSIIRRGFPQKGRQTVPEPAYGSMAGWMLSDIVETECVELFVPQHAPQSGVIHAQAVDQARPVGTGIQVHAFPGIRLVITHHAGWHDAVFGTEKIRGEALLQITQTLHDPLHTGQAMARA